MLSYAFAIESYSLIVAGQIEECCKPLIGNFKERTLLRLQIFKENEKRRKIMFSFCFIVKNENYSFKLIIIIYLVDGKYSKIFLSYQGCKSLNRREMISITKLMNS